MPPRPSDLRPDAAGAISPLTFRSSMAVRVRLTRVGSKKNPIWRVVVADRRSPRDGRSIETIGHYNPQTEPSTIVIDEERLQHWIALGAEPSNTVRKLMRAKDNPRAAPAVVEEATEVQAEAEADAPADVAGATEPEVAPAPEAVEGEPGEQPA